jgi:hypothetical protein
MSVVLVAGLAEGTGALVFDLLVESVAVTDGGDMVALVM